jgi:hypothetical protein
VRRARSVEAAVGGAEGEGGRCASGLHGAVERCASGLHATAKMAPRAGAGLGRGDVDVRHVGLRGGGRRGRAQLVPPVREPADAACPISTG